MTSDLRLKEYVIFQLYVYHKVISILPFFSTSLNNLLSEVFSHDIYLRSSLSVNLNQAVELCKFNDGDVLKQSVTVP